MFISFVLFVVQQRLEFIFVVEVGSAVDAHFGVREEVSEPLVFELGFEFGLRD